MWGGFYLGFGGSCVVWVFFKCKTSVMQHLKLEFYLLTEGQTSFCEIPAGGPEGLFEWHGAELHPR